MDKPFKRIEAYSRARRIVSSATLPTELSQIWGEAAAVELSEDSDTMKRARVTLANIVLLIGNSASCVVNTENLITDLCIRHPSRFFVFCCNSELEQPLKTEVASQCVLAPSGLHVCSEEVYITCNDEVSQGASNLLRSLLVPDVPVVLVVLNDLVGSAASRFQELIKDIISLSDHLVCDSGLFENYSKSVRLMADWFNSPHCADLAWVRTQFWRRLVIEQFDSDVCWSGSCSSIESVTLYVQRGTRSLLCSDALLFSGWVAALLNWEFEEPSCESNGDTIRFNADSGGLRRVLEVISQNTMVNDWESSLLEVVFKVNDSNNRHVRIHLKRGKTDRFISVFSEAASEKSKGEFCDLDVRRVYQKILQPVDLLYPLLQSGYNDKHFGLACQQAIIIAGLFEAHSRKG